MREREKEKKERQGGQADARPVCYPTQGERGLRDNKREMKDRER